MTLFRRGHSRARSLAAAVAAMAAAFALPLAASPAAYAAHAVTASLSSGNWTEAALPSGNYVGDGQNGNAISPVSCAPNSDFCLAVVSNPSVAGPNGLIGQSDVVSTDGGQTWTAYTGLPSSSIWVTSASCVDTSTCWVAGPGPQDQPEVAQSVDGGQTWTLQTPADWASATGSWWPNAIDCVTATTCWLAGATANSTQNPVVAETTDGTDWTTFTNLPTITQYDPNGTYLLNAISCTSALDCVAGGGLNEGDGVAQVISTTDGGVTWTLSADPTLTGVQQIFGLSCLPGSNGLPQCAAAADSLQAAGPVVIFSADGGATWSGMETYDNTGWMSSISCADAAHCWAAGAGTSVALAGTADGGNSWSATTSDTTNEYGTVSCASVSLCVASTDNALWQTSDGGGLGSAGRSASLSRSPAGPLANNPPTRQLPHVSGATVSARSGHPVKVTGQYRGTNPATHASVTIKTPNGKTASATASFGLNQYYSVVLPKLAAGVTTVRFAAGNAPTRTVKVHGYPAAAPRVTGLSSHAGPARGGATLTVTGTNFRHVTAVLFGTARATAVRVISSSKLTVRIPKSTGASYVTVVTKSGGPSALTGRSAFNFLPAPVLKKLLPRSGRPAGGRVVTIWGSGFGYVKAVYFGGNRASRLRIVSAREIKVTTPRGRGKVRVKVVTAGGQTASAPSDIYSY